jgi:hypothetical protein
MPVCAAIDFAQALSGWIPRDHPRPRLRSRDKIGIGVLTVPLREALDVRFYNCDRLL